MILNILFQYLTETFRGYHLLNGIPYNATTDAYGCLMACVENPLCSGLDYDNRTGACFFHNIQSECAQFVIKPYCTHYRLTEQCKYCIGYLFRHIDLSK